MRHMTRERLLANLAAPAIVRAVSLGRIPPRERGLPHFDATTGVLTVDGVVMSPRCMTRDAVLSNAMLYRMPAGIPGDVNRSWASTEEPVQLDGNYQFAAYGLVGVMDQTDFQLRPAGGTAATQKTDTAVVLYGLLIRPFPTNQPTTTQFFGQNPLTSPATGTPPLTGLADVLKRGYMTVALSTSSGAVAGAGAPVFVMVTGANITAAAPGGSIFANNATGTVQAGNAGNTYFRGVADASGNVEIAWNL